MGDVRDRYKTEIGKKKKSNTLNYYIRIYLEIKKKVILTKRYYFDPYPFF